MNFTSIRYTETGFEADGMDIPADPGNRHYQMVMEDVGKGSVIAVEKTSQEIDTDRQVSISTRCQELIYASYSVEDQRNMLAERTRASTTPARHAEIDQVDSWIQQMIDVSRTARADGVALNDVVWPDPPMVLAP